MAKGKKRTPESAGPELGCQAAATYSIISRDGKELIHICSNCFLELRKLHSSAAPPPGGALLLPFRAYPRSADLDEVKCQRAKVPALAG